MKAYRQLDTQISELAAQIALALQLHQPQKVAQLIQDYSERFSKSIVAILGEKLLALGIKADTTVLAFHSQTFPPKFWN